MNNYNKDQKKVARYKLHATRSKGLSLVELLVAIGIVILVLAVGIPAFSRYGKQNELDQAAELVKNALLETQSLALGPPTDKPQEVTLYYFFIENDQRFGIKQGKLDLGNVVEVGNSVIKYFNLPTGISFVATSYQVAYSTTAGSRVVENSSDTIEIKNQKLDDGKVRRLVIYPSSGQITIEKE